MSNLLRKAIAFLLRTFLTDCPRCHQYFYGFHPYITQVKFEIHYRVVCHRCAMDYKTIQIEHKEQRNA